MKAQNTLKPVVNLRQIIFRNVKPKTVQRAEFVVRNIGGDYQKVQVGETEPWLKVIRRRYSVKKDELHFEIRAKSEEQGKAYKDFIDIGINGEKLRIKVVLQTRKKRKANPVVLPPPPITKKVGRGKKIKKALFGILALAILAILIATLIQLQPTTENRGGIINYLTPNETLVTAEFTDIDVGRHKDFPHLLPVLDSNGRELDISLSGAKKIEFETIPFDILKSWPDQFESRTEIPRIRIVVYTTDGSPNAYLMYATYWIYFYNQGKTGIHPCRIKEIYFTQTP